MIHRINLIEKEPFKFSYQKLVNAVLSVALLCALVYGSQVLRVVLAKKKIDALKQEITELKVKQEALVKKAEPKWKGNQATGRFREIFAASPVWTDVIRDVSSRLPPSVWLTGFGTTGGEAKKEGKKEGKKEAKNEKGRKGLISLSGRAKSAADLSIFMSALEESPYIDKAALRQSNIDKGDFAFEIDCDMVKAQ